MEIIGISGKSGVGKDFIYTHILKPLGYYNWSLSWPGKVHIIGKKLATHDDVFVNKTIKSRTLLQIELTKNNRDKYGQDIWCIMMKEYLTLFEKEWGINKFACVDIRFKNELDFVHSLGGKIFRIVAPTRVKNNKLTEDQRNHISEIDLDDNTNFEGYIYNDPKYSETVNHQVLTLLGENEESISSMWDDWRELLEDGKEMIKDMFRPNK